MAEDFDLDLSEATIDETPITPINNKDRKFFYTSTGDTTKQRECYVVGFIPTMNGIDVRYGYMDGGKQSVATRSVLKLNTLNLKGADGNRGQFEFDARLNGQVEGGWSYIKSVQDGETPSLLFMKPDPINQGKFLESTLTFREFNELNGFSQPQQKTS